MRKRMLALLLIVIMIAGLVPAAIAAGITVDTEDELKDAVASGGEIVLGKDIELTEKLVVPAGKTVSIDLKGNTISGSCNASQACLIEVSNTATLNVSDSSEDGSGKITYAQGSSNVGWTIALYGNLNLYSGTIALTGSWSIGYAVDVRPNSWGTEYTEGTVFHMYGGKLDSSDGAIRVASSSADAHEKVSSTFVMDGGTIDAGWDGIFIQQSDAVYDILNVEINRGTIEADMYPVRFYGPAATSVVGDVEKPMNLAINGGTFTYTGNSAGGTSWLVDSAICFGGGTTKEQLFEKASLEIKGGAFDGDPAEYVANGYVVSENAGKYTVAALNLENAAAAIGSNPYATLAEAVAAAENNDTITVQKNVELAEALVIPEGLTVILDLNGKVISGLSAEAQASAVIKNHGTLTVRDSKTGGKITSAPANPDKNDTPGYANNTIYNYGVLNVVSGIIENTGEGSACYPIDTNSQFRDTKLTVSGGKIVASDDSYAIRQWGASETNENEVVITGGELIGYRAIWVQLPGTSVERNPKISLSIQGGILTSTDTTYNSAIYCRAYGKDGYANTEISISGGTINGDVAFSGPSSADMDPAETVSITGGCFNSSNLGVYTYSTHLTKFISGGHFTIKPDTKYIADGMVAVASNEQGYSYTVAVKGEIAVDTHISTGVSGGKVEENLNADDSVKEDLTNAFTSTNMEKTSADATAGLSAAASAVTNDTAVVGNAAILEAAKKAGIEVSEGTEVKDIIPVPEGGEPVSDSNPVTVVVQPYMDITVKEVDTESSAINSITVDIQPMYTLVATTKAVAENPGTEIKTDGADQNAVVLAKEQKMEVNVPVTISIPLPAAFAENCGSLFVVHEKSSGKKFVYSATVAQSGGAWYATFENPNGFSVFSLTPVIGMAAMIEETNVYYDTFAEAVSAVENNQTIKVLMNSDSEAAAVVGRSVAFYVNANGKNYTKPVAGSYTTRDRANGETTPHEYVFTYTVPYIPPVKKECDGGVNCPCKAYTDLNNSQWYHKAADYVLEKGLMNGLGNGIFDPEGTANRAMVITMLWRQAGSPVVNYLMKFSDVPADMWYTEAIRWAAAMGLVEGYGDGTVGVADKITREQAATLLYRYAKYKGEPVNNGIADLNTFADVANIYDWAKDGMKWAVSNKLVEGDGVNLRPADGIRRIELAALLMNYLEK